jgi:hypothetical protein
LDEVNIEESINDRDNERLEVFKVDTDVTDILLYNSNVNHFGSSRNDLKSKAKYIPRDEWDNLTQLPKDSLIEKHRKERFGAANGLSKS